jgi:hypothetical protein
MLLVYFAASFGRKEFMKMIRYDEDTALQTNNG